MAQGDSPLVQKLDDAMPQLAIALFPMKMALANRELEQWFKAQYMSEDEQAALLNHVRDDQDVVEQAAILTPYFGGREDLAHTFAARHFVLSLASSVAIVRAQELASPYNDSPAATLKQKAEWNAVLVEIKERLKEEMTQKGGIGEHEAELQYQRFLGNVDHFVVSIIGGHIGLQ